MNSLQDLNAWGNTAINFADPDAYDIVFGTAAGNITLSVAEDSEFAVPKQTAITTLDDATQDVLVTFVVDDATRVDDIYYTGNFGNIAVQKTSTDTWTGLGIRNITRYDELFANTRVVLPADSIDNFDIVVTVNDQRGNTQSWTVTTAITDSPEFTAPDTVFGIVGEDSVLDQFAIVDAADDRQYQVIIATTDSTEADIVYLGSVGPVTLTGTKSDINTVLTSGDIKFRPFVRIDAGIDFATTPDSQITYYQKQTTDNIVQADTVTVPTAAAAAAGLPAFYFEDTIIKSSSLPEYFNPDTSSDQYSVLLQLQPSSNVTLSYDGITGTSALITGTAAEVKTELAQVVINNWENNNLFVGGSRPLVATQTNTTQNRDDGTQEFWVQTESALRVGLSLVFPTTTDLPGLTVVSATALNDASYPYRTPWRVNDTTGDSFQLNLSRHSGTGLLRFKIGNFWYSSVTHSFGGTAEQINDQMFWDRFGITGHTGSITEFDFDLVNTTTSTTVTSGRLQFQTADITNLDLVMILDDTE